MRNDSEGVDVGTTTEVDEYSEGAPEAPVVSEEDEPNVLPSGSRTLDTRLNPEAPDFVPGVTNRMLAAKIVDELVGYTRWSTATGEDISYGPRYDSIWSESFIQSSAVQPGDIIETVGDQEQLPSPKKNRSDNHRASELESACERSPSGCCCACM